MLLYIDEIDDFVKSKRLEYAVVGDELGDLVKLQKTDMTLDFYRVGETICLKIVGNFTVLTCCDRCLADLELEIEVDDSYYLFPENTPDVDYFYKGDFIETDDFVREIVLMNMPDKILCKEDCKGLCSKCGCDLNLGKCRCDSGSEKL